MFIFMIQNTRSAVAVNKAPVPDQSLQVKQSFTFYCINTFYGLATCNCSETKFYILLHLAMIAMIAVKQSFTFYSIINMVYGLATD